MIEKDLKVTIIIPTLDEIEGMKWFMPRIKKEWYDELIIVDGGSTDGTVEYCRENDYPIFIQSKKGYARALDEAFRRSTKDIIVTTTADGSSLPELIPGLIAKIREGYDMVIASRYLGPAKSLDDDIFTSFGNRMFTAMINSLFGGRYTDTLVALRAYRRGAVNRMFLYDQDKQFWLKKIFLEMNSWETASSIRAAEFKLKVYELPGDEPKRIGGKRKLSIVKNGLGTLFQILHEFITGCSFLENFLVEQNQEKKNDY